MTEPPLIEVEPGHKMACHIPLEELRILQRQRTTEGAGDVEAALAKAAETTGQSIEELAEAVQEAEAAGETAAETSDPRETADNEHASRQWDADSVPGDPEPSRARGSEALEDEPDATD